VRFSYDFLLFGESPSSFFGALSGSLMTFESALSSVGVSRQEGCDSKAKKVLVQSTTGALPA
jgi:hypothetical protein